MLRLTFALICITSLVFTTDVDAELAKMLQETYKRLKAVDEKVASDRVDLHIICKNAPERRQSGDPVVDVSAKPCL